MTFAPGQSGNPRGRPRKERTVTEQLRRIFDGRREGASQSRLEEALTRLADMAAKGDLGAIRISLAYLEGKPVDRVQAFGANPVPFSADDVAAAASRVLEFRRSFSAASPPSASLRDGVQVSGTDSEAAGAG